MQIAALEKANTPPKPRGLDNIDRAILKAAGATSMGTENHYGRIRKTLGEDAQGFENPHEGYPSTIRGLLGDWLLKEERRKEKQGLYVFAPHPAHLEVKDAYRRLVGLGMDGSQFNHLLSKAMGVPELAMLILRNWSNDRTPSEE